MESFLCEAVKACVLVSGALIVSVGTSVEDVFPGTAQLVLAMNNTAAIKEQIGVVFLGVPALKCSAVGLSATSPRGDDAATGFSLLSLTQGAGDVK